MLRGFFLALVIFGIVVRASAKNQDENVIDAHVHLNFDDKIETLSGINYSKEEFLKEAKAAGVTGFVAHTLLKKPPSLTCQG